MAKPSRPVQPEGDDAGDLLEVTVPGEQLGVISQGHVGDQAVNEVPGCDTGDTALAIDPGRSLEVCDGIAGRPGEGHKHPVKAFGLSVCASAGQHFHQDRVGGEQPLPSVRYELGQ